MRYKLRHPWYRFIKEYVLGYHCLDNMHVCPRRDHPSARVHSRDRHVHFFLHKGRYHVDNNNGSFVSFVASGWWHMERERSHCYKTYGLPSGSYTSSPTILGPPALGPANPSSNYPTQASIAGKAIRWASCSVHFPFLWKMASAKATFITSLVIVAIIGVIAVQDIRK